MGALILILLLSASLRTSWNVSDCPGMEAVATTLTPTTVTDWLLNTLRLKVFWSIRHSLKVSQPEAEARLATSAAPPPFSAATNAFCVTDLNCSCVPSCSIDPNQHKLSKS